ISPCGTCRHESASSTPAPKSSSSATTAAAACRRRCSWYGQASPACTTWRAAWMPGRARSTRRCQFTDKVYSMRRVLLLALAFIASPAPAQDLLQVYRDAKAFDAQYASAKYALQAGLEKLPQGRSLLLPPRTLTPATPPNHL